ncbi:hypothetical protein M378DRAFT_10208 [Amanita muscaria Koide BX008]|uniref:Uncharacterized protein n=1 Tax=Amanita muscaria (strain Koide BX008) TaxID=946122 RepID=A0A0C2WWM6_AMAMK|nr:hypothetical protein M378DRAFT_10208 [Amanita muscaria Koide BX008]
MSRWVPKRSLTETDAILCAPGAIHEVETRLVSGRLLRVYKNLWPTLRDFWLAAVQQYSQKTYIVFEEQRFTYQDVHDQATKLACIFKHKYNIHKAFPPGDRVAVCSKNCPEYLIAFWACHLIGAISVLVNAWLPLEPLQHCIAHTGCKLLLLDDERADRLQPFLTTSAQEAGTHGFLLLNSIEGKGNCRTMESLDSVLHQFRGSAILETSHNIMPEDNATIMFTSGKFRYLCAVSDFGIPQGTTGLPKGVLSSHRQFLTNVLNVLTGSWRAALRRGDDLPPLQSGTPQKGALIAVPLFHVTGTTSYMMMATMSGMKIVLARKWHAEEAARLIKAENITITGGVPTMVSDIIESSIVGYPLEGLLFGGSPAPPSLVPRAQNAFPTAIMIQGYGMTETNSIAVSVCHVLLPCFINQGNLKIAGEDYIARPTSTGLPCPVNEVKIVLENVSLPPGALGEVWLYVIDVRDYENKRQISNFSRGPNVMKGYWNDNVATDKTITVDGWIKTGDLGYVDEEGFLYIKDRMKDIIIRGGENVDSVSVENALYADPRVLEAAVVGVPDDRLGELVAAVVSVKPEFHGRVTEAALIETAQKRLPKFATPVMIIVQEEALGKFPIGMTVTKSD